MVIGGLTSVLYAMIVYPLYSYLSFSTIVASTIAYSVTIPVNFIGQRHSTFKSKNDVRQEILPFLLLHIVNIAVAGAALTWATNFFGNILVGSIIVIIVIPINSYLVSKFLIFKDTSPPYN